MSRKKKAGSIKTGEQLLKRYSKGGQHLADLLFERPFKAGLRSIARSAKWAKALTKNQKAPRWNKSLLDFADNDLLGYVIQLIVMAQGELFIRKNRVQAEVLYRRARSIKAPSSLGLDYLLTHCQINLLDHQNNFLDQISILEKLCERTRETRYFHLRACMLHLQNLYIVSDVKRLRGFLKKLKRQHGRHRSYRALIEFHDFSLLAYGEDLSQKSKDCHKIEKHLKPLKDMGVGNVENYYAYLIHFLSLFEEVDGNLLKKYQPDDILKLSVEIKKHLLASEPEKALECAARAYQLGERTPRVSTLQAQLGCRMLEASQQSLERYEASRGEYVFADLLRARLCHLQQNFEEARSYFQKAKRQAQQLKLMELFKIDLKCANEWGGLDVYELQEPSAAARHVNFRLSDFSTESYGSGEALMGLKYQGCTVLKAITRFAALDEVVLITGESGTGKGLVARQLHRQSARSKHPFVTLNCGALNVSLIESELFGHVKGAFTGADQAATGLVEAAGQGVLFLDDVSELPRQAQVLLLRLLENNEYRVVGSTEVSQSHCRFVCASNRDLEEAVAEGRFREDLYYRISKLSLNLPPLRERGNDVLLLASYFMGRVGDEKMWAPPLRRQLTSYDWPGNVRELKNEMEYVLHMQPAQKTYTVGDLRPGALTGHAGGKKSQTVYGEGVTLGNNKQTRLKLMAELFRQRQRLNRHEVARYFGISTFTATYDLKYLIDEGVVRKVEPSKSPRTHYFEYAQG